MNKKLSILLLIFSIAQNAPYFDSERAYNYLLKQCDIGFRYPGSEGQIEFKNFLIDFLSDKADTLIVDEHQLKHPYY